MSRSRAPGDGRTRRVLGLLAVAGVLVFVAGVAAVVATAVVWLSGDDLPERTVLELDLGAPIVESAPRDAIHRAITGPAISVRDVVDALDRARDDDRVLGVFGRLGAIRPGMGHVEEILEALERFRAAGKPAVAFAESFGEFGPGEGSYLLATGFDRIVLQPSGDVGLTGLRVERLFLTEALGRFGVRAEVVRTGAYKEAMGTYVDTAISAEQRAALEALLATWEETLVAALVERRGFDPGEALERLHGGPYVAREAFEIGLVDGVAYRDEALRSLLEQVGNDAVTRGLEAYLSAAGRPRDDGDAIVALVRIDGEIVRGRGGLDPLTGERTVGSDDLTRAFREVRDAEPRAVVVRVDSPGGSYVGSDAAWREIVRLKADGIPVVISMGNVAASGAYLAVVGADRIVAEPGTITGSIGVVAGKFVLAGLAERYGVGVDAVDTAERSEMWSAWHGFDEAARQRVGVFVEQAYEDFVAKVARGRSLEPAAVLEVAEGRVWSGRDAFENGLVDRLGGLGTAIEEAARLAGIEDGVAVRVQEIPEPRGLLRQWLTGRSSSSSVAGRRWPFEGVSAPVRQGATDVEATPFDRTGILALAPVGTWRP